MTEGLDLEDLLVTAEAILGRRPEIRDVGLLEAALARPLASAFGVAAYPTFDMKAAGLLHSIVTGRALVDGNRRLGWVACRLFYRLNGADLRMPADAAYELVVAIADGTLRDTALIAARMRSFVVPLDT